MDRNFGVEIECHSAKKRNDIALILEETLNKAFPGEGYTVRSTNYSHSNDGLNTKHWYVKEDSSLRESPYVPREAQNDIEVVTPVLRGEHGMELLKTVCFALQEHTVISRLCGLHVHQEITEKELLELAVKWVNVERWFFQLLPKSRQRNHYCKEWSSISALPIENFIEKAQKDIREEGAEDWYSDHDMDRYFSLNLNSFHLRSTSEFRLFSGTISWEKIYHWIVLTKRLIDCPVSEFMAVIPSWEKFLEIMFPVKKAPKSSPLTEAEFQRIKKIATQKLAKIEPVLSLNSQTIMRLSEENMNLDKLGDRWIPTYLGFLKKMPDRLEYQLELFDIVSQQVAISTFTAKQLLTNEQEKRRVRRALREMTQGETRQKFYYSIIRARKIITENVLEDWSMVKNWIVKRRDVMQQNVEI